VDECECISRSGNICILTLAAIQVPQHDHSCCCHPPPAAANASTIKCWYMYMYAYLVYYVDSSKKYTTFIYYLFIIYTHTFVGRFKNISMVPDGAHKNAPSLLHQDASSQWFFIHFHSFLFFIVHFNFHFSVSFLLLLLLLIICNSDTIR